MAKRPHITETTRKNLMDAFWKLYQIKSVENISIREITDIAGYNRGTFYLYFKDIYDVLDNIEKDVLLVMDSEIEKHRKILGSRETEPDISEITSAAIEICKACDFRPLILLSDRGDPRFEETVKKKMHETLFENIDRSVDADDCTKEYIVHFFISGVIGVLKKWYNDGMVIPVEEHLAAVCNVLFGSKNLIKTENGTCCTLGKGK